MHKWWNRLRQPWRTNLNDLLCHISVGQLSFATMSDHFKLIIRFVWTETWWLLGCNELLTNMDSPRIKIQGKKLMYICRISISISLNGEVFDLDQTLTSCSIGMSSSYIALCCTEDAHIRSINPRDVWYSRISRLRQCVW